MPKAIWNGTVLAESNDTKIIDGNHYFPPDTIHRQHFEPSQTHTVCPWKGQASYYHIRVGDAVNEDAAWYYPAALPDAKEFEGYVAFWKGVEVQR